MPTLEESLNSINAMRDDMVSFMVALLKIRAVNPDGGGEGEYSRAIFVKETLDKLGVEVSRYDIPDPDVSEGIRINLTSIIKGRDNRRTLWFAAHLDTVPEGARELWSTDPFEPVVKDGKIFARGAEDNGQAIASTLFAFKALESSGAKPPINVGVAYVSDEESGSRHGVIPLLEKGVFRADDMVVVPDSGAPDGGLIEIAEKSILWLKFTTRGRQVHASTPEKGLNACRAGLKLASELDSLLHSKYVANDSLFEPPTSTFEPTKHELNVDNVNTVPGVDVQYFDCRILPQYQVEDVLKDIESVTIRVEKETGTKIEIQPVQREQSTAPTLPDSEIVTDLRAALRELRAVDARPVGIGGGTVALYFRRKGIPTAVWSTLDEMAHQPNEYCKIGNMIEDAKVFLHVAMAHGDSAV